MNPQISAAAFYPDPRSCAPREHPDLVFSREDPRGSATGETHAARILIVEDEYLVALQMEGELTKAGFQIVGIASSAQEALTYAAAQRPELVLMDIRLRGKRDGIDGAAELFTKHGIRSLFVTAHHDADARARAQAANPIGWLPKPFSAPLLIEVVRGALRSLRSEKQ